MVPSLEVKERKLRELLKEYYRRHAFKNTEKDSAFKQSFMYNFLKWLRVYIGEQSLSMLDFVYWLSFMQWVRVNFLCITPLGYGLLVPLYTPCLLVCFLLCIVDINVFLPIKKNYLQLHNMNIFILYQPIL